MRAFLSGTTGLIALAAGFLPLSVSAQTSAPPAVASKAKPSPAAREQQIEALVAEITPIFAAGDYARAEPKIAQLLDLYRMHYGANHSQTIRTMVDLLALRSLLEQYDTAEPVARALIASLIATVGEDHGNTIGAREQLGLILFQLNRRSEAADMLKLALDSRVRLDGPNAENTLEKRNELAGAYSVAQRTAEAAEQFRLMALGYGEALGPTHPETLSAIQRQATLTAALGKTADALALLTVARQACRDVGVADSRQCLELESKRADLLLGSGDARGAQEAYLLMVTRSRQLFGAGDPLSIELALQLGTLLEGDGRTEAALPMLEDAYAAAQTLPADPDSLRLRSAAGYAAILSQLGRVDEAAQLAETVLAGRLAQGKSAERFTVTALGNLSYYEKQRSNLPRAIDLARQAVALTESIYGPDHADTLEVQSNYASLLADQRDYAAAAPLLRDVAQRTRRLLGPDHPQTNLRETILAYTLLSLPAQQGEALEWATSAAAGYQMQLAGLGSGPGDAAQLAQVADDSDVRQLLYADAAWARPAGKTALQGDVFTALQTEMVSKTTLALGRSAARRVADRKGLAEVVAQREDALAQYDALSASIIQTSASAGAGNLARTSEAMAQRTQIVADVAQIDAQLQATAPEFFALLRPGTLDLAQTQALLGADEAALLLVPSLFGAHAMVITDSGITWHRSDVPGLEIKALVQRLLYNLGADVPLDDRTRLLQQEAGEGAVPYDVDAAVALYDELIKPVEPALAGKTHVFVAASGSLSRLPLGVLLREKPAGMNGDPDVLRRAPWLADAYAITAIPSLQSLQFIRQYGASQGGDVPRMPFLGFGDPILGGIARTRGARGVTRGAAQPAMNLLFQTADNGAKAGLADVAQLKTMASLPGTADELRAQWQAFGSPDAALFLGAEASETRLKATPLFADVITFATHGLTAGEIAGAAEPGLVFSPPETATTLDDGYLTASEIAALSIKSDWVILSACNTAAGDGNGGGGFSGLARSFFYAGARNILVSHWPVRDDVAARLTVRAIELSRDNPALSRAQALQRAMRDIRNNSSADSNEDSWAHPSAWAPFSLVGDGATR